MEGWALGLFMLSASFFAVLLETSGSPVRHALPDPLLRRVLMGAAMGLTAMGNIYSPWGRRSGAHMNPSVTLTFFRLGKIQNADALFYVTAQFIGAAAGLGLAVLLFGHAVSDIPVRYVMTRPGVWGEAAAFCAEALMAFALMSLVLRVSNHPRLTSWTGVLAGILVALFIILEAPVSGMSLNPARSLAPALAAREGQGLWVYFTAPLAGMLAAAELYVRQAGLARVFCAKLNHSREARCIFRCNYGRIKS